MIYTTRRFATKAEWVRPVPRDCQDFNLWLAYTTYSNNNNRYVVIIVINTIKETRIGRHDFQTITVCGTDNIFVLGVLLYYMCVKDVIILLC